MKRLIKPLSFLGATLVVLLLVLILVGPYEDSELSVDFDPAVMQDGITPYFAEREAAFDDITAGVEKQVIWAGAPEEKAPWAILYLHGFSATAQEIRPVPDRVADALGANLILTRLTGHGRDGAAMAEASVSDWMRDVAEGLAAARLAGERVLILSTSTGGTLAAAAALDPELAEDVAGIVFISPNFGINNPLAPLLTFPAARNWLPILAGKSRSFDPHNAAQALYWTTEYPTVSVLPMAALVARVSELDLAQTEIPALFWFSPEDEVVRPELTALAASRWGGAVTIVNPELGPGDDPSRHVIAGDILSPAQNDAVVAGIVDWAEEL